MATPNRDVLAQWFPRDGRQAVDLIFAGRIFGGRSGEASQFPRDYHFDGQTLSIRFATTESLTVEAPSDFVLGRDGELIIPRAKKATFGWHSYGGPQTARTWCEEIYELTGNEVTLRRTGPVLPGEETFPLAGKRFVELVKWH